MRAAGQVQAHLAGGRQRPRVPEPEPELVLRLVQKRVLQPAPQALEPLPEQELQGKDQIGRFQVPHDRRVARKSGRAFGNATGNELPDDDADGQRGHKGRPVDLEQPAPEEAQADHPDGRADDKPKGAQHAASVAGLRVSPGEIQYQRQGAAKCS